MFSGLKKLTLKLDRMPKVTDTLFKTVLSKMKLKELVLVSDTPLTQVNYFQNINVASKYTLFSK